MRESHNGEVTPDNRHQHIIVRAEISRPPSKDESSDVCVWISQLIKNIGMKELIAPRAVYCDVVGNRGFTAIAAIETSHLAIHVWDECKPAILQFDLYTCSELDVNQVVNELQRFEPTKIEWKFFDREFKLVLVKES